MARPERPITGSGAVAELARRLRDARRQAGQGCAASGAGELERAVNLYRRALDEWTGDALEDMGWTHHLLGEQGALEEKRRAAQIECIGTQLALGRHQDAAIMCRQLLGQYPLDQQLTGLLMRALAHLGRPAEAVDLYQQTRTRLGEQLGLAPGSRLREVHVAVLRGEFD